MRHGEDRGWPVRNSAKDSEQRSAKDADQNGPMKFSRHQDESENKAETRGLHFFIGKTAETHVSRRVGDDEFSVPQTHERDKHPNARSRGVLQAVGHAVRNLFANTGYGKNKKEHAGAKNHRKRSLPRNVHGQADGISEVGVQRHSRRQSDGIVGVESHDKRGYGSGDTRRKNHAFRRHSRLRQNLRIHHDDVCHGDKSRNAA